MTVPAEARDPYALARAAAAEVAAATGIGGHDVAIVLGSGWSPALDELGVADAEIPMHELAGFPAPTVAGHSGVVRSVRVQALRVLVLAGRVHLYEGHPPATVVHGVRTAAAAGCRVVVLTNAAGALNAEYEVGQAVLIRDHLNLTAASPLEGPAPPAGYGLPFVDLTDLYSARLRALAHAEGPNLAEGVYAGLRGPHYETPAEVAMLTSNGADLVGMSTVLEAIAARHLGLEILGVSLVTNAAAGRTGAPLDHAEVVAAGKASAARVGRLLARVVATL
ncbi:MAG TPA: purine-nucleoside phosphorylase [Acidimicrobiales bacterium]|nr:purine-nucleoside phosphorylase [Acidimicrobiales bacterium]